MEIVGDLFDTCDDELHSGKVPVSILITAMKNEIPNSDNEREANLLQAVYDLLDPLQQDPLIDKATWIKAWQKMQSDADLNFTVSPCDGLLDQSKQSYCFSPGSPSSLESETEDVFILKEENDCLKNNIKILKDQLQNQEDSLIQEQTERREIEKKYASAENQIMKLTKQVKYLQESNTDLQSSIVSCEREKNKFAEQFHTTEKQLRGQTAAKNNEIMILNKEIEELNQTNIVLKCDIDQLKILLDQTVKAHGEQIREYKEAMQAERDEISTKITQSFSHRRDLAARLEECDFSGVDLQSELLESTNVDMNSCTAHTPKILSVASSTPRNVHVKPAVTTSLLEEMQAFGSGIDSSSILDCSFDVQTSQHHSGSESDDSYSSSGVERVPDPRHSPSIPLKGNFVQYAKQNEFSGNSCESFKTSGSQALLQDRLSNKARQPSLGEFSPPPLENDADLLLEKNQTILHKVGHIESFKSLQTCDLIKSSPENIKANLISSRSDDEFPNELHQHAQIQSHHANTQTIIVQMYEVGIQTSPLNCGMEIPTTHLPVCDAGTQTTEVCEVETENTHYYSDMGSSDIYPPVCGMEIPTTQLTVCDVGTQTTEVCEVETENTHYYSDMGSSDIYPPVCAMETKTKLRDEFSESDWSQDCVTESENVALKKLEASILELSSNDGCQSHREMNVNSCDNDLFREKGSLTHSNTRCKAIYEGKDEEIEYGIHYFGHSKIRRHTPEDTLVKLPTKTPTKELMPSHKVISFEIENISSNSPIKYFEEQFVSEDASNNDVAHSTVQKNELPALKMNLFKQRLKLLLAVICLSCLFVMLLFCSTVVLSVGVLETITQSGVISGTTPRWAAPKWISQFTYLVRPFLKVEERTREPIV
ncbi:uncharacterized protein LOC113209913 [Frankliniella occidentalis]|uniref:Uncharacterized protein LOC113209913 n=1 Tax=Frankliniella occidentalis TaxID=133901 RepID=A0A6J1SRE0_FRAOC|nr:uncharacterized protein LOC113209913 [Frankliniella occidentalis]